MNDDRYNWEFVAVVCFSVAFWSVVVYAIQWAT